MAAATADAKALSSDESLFIIKLNAKLPAKQPASTVFRSLLLCVIFSRFSTLVIELLSEWKALLSDSLMSSAGDFFMRLFARLLLLLSPFCTRTKFAAVVVAETR